MNSAIRSIVLVLASMVGTVSASEGDMLFEFGPYAINRTVLDRAPMGLGGTMSVLAGFNSRTDLGLSISMDHLAGRKGGMDLTSGSMDFQSFYTAFNGDIRPQVGGSMGIGYNSDGDVSLHLGGRIRALFELNTQFRIYTGAGIGADLGENGSTSTRAEFGGQFLLH